MSQVIRPLKVVQGSFHQGDTRFGTTAGIQCSCNAIVSLCFSKIRKVSIWKAQDLDYILSAGDTNFKRLGFTESPFVDQFPDSVLLEGDKCLIEFNPSCDGEFISNEVAINFITEKLLLQNCGVVLVISGYSVAVIHHNREFYLFDSHSRDIEGKITECGTSILMSFLSLNSLKSYIQNTYNTTFFQLLYVRTHFENFNSTKSLVIKTILNYQKQNSHHKVRKERIGTDKHKLEKDKAREKRKRSYDTMKNTDEMLKEKDKMRKTAKKIFNKNIGTEKHDEKKAKMRKTAKEIFNQNVGTEKHDEKKARIRKTNKQSYSDNIGTEKHEKRKQKMRETYKKNTARIRVQHFKNIIQEGPYFICVSCNRCMYKRCVKLFVKKQYDIDLDTLIYNYVKSFDNKKYICLTCHKKLLKSEVPCQTVSNKLEIKDFPFNVNIRKLERILLSQRILFSKIVIMHKGEFPKLRGAICNIPVETANTCELLPRGSDSSGVINVELKRKLSFKHPFISQQVCKGTIQTVLNYLVTHNPLYANIRIRSMDEFNDIDINNALGNETSNTQHDTDSSSNSVEDIKFVDENTVTIINEFEEKENEYELEDPLNTFRSRASETLMVSEIPNVLLDDENIILAPGEGKTPYSLITDEHCEELSHPHLFPTGKFGYKAEREIKLSPTKYFNQRLLNYTQKFSSDSDYIFFAHQILLQLSLKNNISIALRKVKNCKNLTAGMLGNNFTERVKEFVASDNAYKFMSTVKGTPAYWKNMLSDVMAMIKQLGIPSYFMTLSCADLRWNELIKIIRRLQGVDTSNLDFENLDYETRCNELNSNPVLLARHFQFRVENFFKEIIMKGPLGKIIYYAIRVEFQVRGSPHVHCLLWASDSPKLTSTTKFEYIQHIDNVISAVIPSSDENSELQKLVKTFQIHSHSKTCSKYRKNECRFGFGKFFCKQTILSEPLSDDLSEIEKHNILVKRNDILNKVQSYIDNNLHPRKQNFLDPCKPNYVETQSIDDILNSMDLNYEEYEYCLSISPDKDTHLFLRRDPKSCFVNNYFADGLLAWEANIDIQPVYNPYKAVTYMCAYFSKSEDKCSSAMKDALKVAEDSEKSKYEIMSNVAKAYNSNRECSVQEAVYLTLPELWLRKCFPVIQFVNTNLPEQRYKIFKSKAEIEELPDDSDEVFKQNMIDRYIDRPNSSFMKGKFSQFDVMCLATFCANYVLDTKVEKEKNDWQPIVLDEAVNEINHTERSLPKTALLMSTKEKLKLRKVPKVLRYYTPNKHRQPEKYAHHMLMLFFPFRCEETDLQVNGSYILKLNQSDVIATVNNNKEEFEPNSEIVDLVLQNYYNDIQHNQDPFAQQENEEVLNLMSNVEFDDEFNNKECVSDENTLYGAFATSCHHMQSDEAINSHIRSLNKKQREIFDVLLDWAKKFVQNSNSRQPAHLEPIRLFLTGGGGVGKSHLIKCIFDCLSKLLAYKKEELEKPRVIKLAPTGIAAINIEGTTIHTGLNIPIGNFIPMSDKQRSAMRNKLLHVQLIIIDEISMVSSKLLLNIHRRLCEIFGVRENIPFAGKSLLLCGDLHQLAPILAKPVFSLEGESINAHKLWHLFNLAELTETMRQKGNISFVELLNNIRVGEMSEENERVIKSRFIGTEDSKYPWNAIHLFAENECVNIHNLKMLSTLPTEHLIIPCIDQYPSTFTDREKNAVKCMKQTDTGNLAFELELKVGARIMLLNNIDIDDRLINGQLGTVTNFKFRNGRVEVILIKFDDIKAGLKARRKNQFANSTQSVPIERTEAKFSITKRKSSSSPQILRTQFPLMLSYACTVHKVQGLTLESAVISFDLRKQRSFNPGQMYVAMSRVKTIEGLFFTGEFKRNAFACNKNVTDEYTRLRINDRRALLVDNFRLCNISLNICLLNIRSLKKHAIDIQRDDFLKHNDILCLTETQIGYEHSGNDLAIVNQILNNYKLSYNNDHNRFNSIALCTQKSCIDVIEYDHLSGFSVVKFRKELFCGDFNINAFELDETSLLNDVLKDYRQQIDFTTHIDGGLLDHVYVHHDLYAEFDFRTTRKCVNISDHDAVKINIMTKEQ